MAQALGEAGAKVVLSSRKAQDLEEAAAELQAAGHRRAMDCRRLRASEKDIPRLADEPVQRVGHVDILVNNAGASWGAPAEDHPMAAWDKVMNLNVRGYFLLSQAMAKASMLARERPHHQRGLHCRPGRQPRGHEDHCLQHLQGRGAELHARAGRRMGPHSITRECHLPGLLPHQDGRGADRHHGRGRTWPAARRCAAWATMKTSRA